MPDPSNENSIHVNQAEWQSVDGSVTASSIEKMVLPFVSTHGYDPALPREQEVENRSLSALFKYYLSRCPVTSRLVLNQGGADRQNNDHFSYTLLRSVGTTPARGTLVLLHGLNEKSWDKYWPWAVRLAELTGRTVVLFPLAYHMNRAPRDWADPRSMRGVVKERQQLFPHLSNLSFANVALSQRLQFAPELFIRSGLQSLYDLQALMRQIRCGAHPWIPANVPVDLFGYSIGATLGEAALMADTENLFDKSRMVLFCGGSTLDRANPVSKAILDSEAALSLQQFFRMPEDACLDLSDAQRQSLQALFAKGRQPETWKKLQRRTLVMGLEHDTVFSGDALRDTFRDQDIDLEIFNPAYATRHENPFPKDRGGSYDAQRLLDRVMQRAATFIAS